MKDNLSAIRNIGFVAHIDAGKTTTTERLLFYTGRTYKIGEVDSGTTVTDWMVQERERGITITSAATFCTWRDYHINIIDTPGHIDFTVEVERSLKVLDGVVVIFCAVGGVEPQSETVWHQADKYHVPKIAFINKLDRVGADFFTVFEEMKQKLNSLIIPVQLPIYENDEFTGIVDLISNKAVYYDDQLGTKIVYKDIPQHLLSAAAKYRDNIIEKLAELDDSFMQKAIEGAISEKEIISSLRKHVIANHCVPLVCGSALKNKGIQHLLDAICDFLPSPKDVGPVKGFKGSSETDFQTREIAVSSPLCALCFKIFTDPFVGKLFYTRIYSGKINTSSAIYNASKRLREKVSKILRMHANKQEIVSTAAAGDIVCLVGLKDTTTGDTLCDEKFLITLEAIKFPLPVVSVAIEPRTKADQEKLFAGLKKLEEEDPSFKVIYNRETGQNIISGMGQLHLEIMVDRLLREFNVQAKIGKPQVAYKETITRKVETVGKFIQQTGGHGQYGHVVLLMEPLDKGMGIIFENKVKGGSIPKEFFASIKEGVFEAAESGALGGYPVVDIRITLLDGSYHEVDSSELAFKIATEYAFKDGLRKAGPVILEPIMELEVLVANEYLSQVIGDLNTRRAKISSIVERKNLKIVRADVPLSEVFNYADVLRNLTQGRASYTIEPSYYEKVPGEMLSKILGI
ncbi:MAG: elongation factor G [Candidatus Omnitrophica bacterium]|nr:elongation factor G [Candidatus Omnitrophota bacterium]